MMARACATIRRAPFSAAIAYSQLVFLQRVCLFFGLVSSRYSRDLRRGTRPQSSIRQLHPKKMLVSLHYDLSLDFHRTP